jgi:hypothetical protein
MYVLLFVGPTVLYDFNGLKARIEVTAALVVIRRWFRQAKSVNIGAEQVALTTDVTENPIRQLRNSMAWCLFKHETASPFYLYSEKNSTGCTKNVWLCY